MSRFRVLIPGVLLLAATPPLLTEAQENERETLSGHRAMKLFAIPYGSAPHQVGLRAQPGIPSDGPGHVSVDAEGNIWLLDRINCQVKAFRRDGTLLRAVGRVLDRDDDGDGPPETMTPLERMGTAQAYAVDGRQRVYLLADNSTHLFVIGAADGLIENEYDAYGHLVEARGEQKLVSQLRQKYPQLPNSPIGHLAPLDVMTDRSDHLYLLARAPVRTKQQRGRQTALYEFTQELECLGIAPGRCMAPDGYTFEFARDPEDGFVQFHAYDPQGKRIRTTRFLRPGGPGSRFSWVLFDRDHDCYFLYRKKRDERMSVMPGLDIRSDYDVLKVTSEGVLLAEFTIPGSPVGTGIDSPIAVDDDDNVYYLAFGASGVRVMMVRTGIAPQDANER